MKITEDMPKSLAKKFLSSDEVSVQFQYPAFKRLLGRMALSYEPETIWLELAREGINPSECLRDRIMAILALQSNEKFFWDYGVFHNVVMAFNCESVNPGRLQVLTPGQLVVGVTESRMLFHTMHGETEIPEFDHEPQAYTAACFERAGMIYAPKPRDFCQDILDTLNNCDNCELKQKVQEEWERIPESEILSHAYPETPVGVQLAKLAAMHVYVKEKADKYMSDLASLKQAA